MTKTMARILDNSIAAPGIRPIMHELLAFEHWHIAKETLTTLKEEQLYHSWLHGVRHTERVILLGAVCAMDQGFDERDTWYTAMACLYHDIGRENDGLDIYHSERSAQLLPQMRDFKEEDLRLLQAAIQAHSGKLNARQCVAKFAPKDTERCYRVLKALRDADRLDRVRLYDFDPQFLQFEASKQRAGFAKALYQAYLLE